MEITREQIARFFNDALPAEEAEVVAGFLEENAGIAAEFLQEDWEAGTGEDVGLPKGHSDKMYTHIKEQLALPRIGIQKPAYSLAAAAVLMLLCAGGWLLMQHYTGKPLAAVMPVAKQKESRASAVVPAQQWQTHHNTTGGKQTVTLPDGTATVLYAHSRIRYQLPFGSKREIFLKGKASFDVACDKTKPFVVYAGVTSTTALGTCFCIAENEAGITVKLYSGKVLVQPVNTGAEGWHDKVILQPGQQLAYTTSTATAAVSQFGKETHPVTPAIAAASGGMLQFSRMPMDKVLQTLSAHYKQPIYWNKQDVDNMYFTGKVLSSDSLPGILRIIGRMNGLLISQQKNSILVQAP